MTSIPKWLKFILSLLVAEGAGLLGSVFTFQAIPTWYATLQRPAIAPPNWVFGPVWTLLYALMAVAAYLIWTREGTPKKNAVIVYIIQLFFNVLWSFLFFGLHRIDLALIDILVLWLAIIATMIAFYRIHKPAAYLLIPYLLWVSFAIILNYSFWQLN